MGVALPGIDDPVRAALPREAATCFGCDQTTFDEARVAPVYARQLSARGQLWAEQSLALKSTTAVFAAAVAQVND